MNPLTDADCDFNTSHVSINLMHHLELLNMQIISIHLMFLLISRRRRKYPLAHQISIHLMFLLILARTETGRLCYWFQYISCSYSSILKVYDFTVFEHFNTSHVSINPTLLSAFPFLLYLKFLENTSFFKFFPSVSQT